MAKDEFVAHFVTQSSDLRRPRSRAARVASTRAYETDVYGWALDQAEHIRAGDHALIDAKNVADEIEDVGRRELHILESNLTIVLQHMLKRDYQPDQRSRSWASSIREHRRRVLRTLADSPSLAARRDDAVLHAYEDARDKATAETNLPLSTFPEVNPYPWAEMFERSFVHGVE